MFSLVEPELRSFEGRLAAELQSSVVFIEAIGEDLVRAGGKRLRPSLSFLAGRLLGADAEVTMRVALAVELLHSASLLHDDLIDDALTRRGQDAAFRRYGNVVSVMAGDFMLARVLRILAQLDHAGFTLLMSDTATRICEGEVLQFEVASLGNYSLENYFRIIEGKTAVLFVAALGGVAMLAGVKEEEQEALRHFGLSYGRAFQMQDDYLDLLGDPERMGKPVGGDLREGKATYPVLRLLEEGVSEARALLEQRCEKEGDIERMRALVRERGADEATRTRITQEVDEALSALMVFPASPAREALMKLAQQELARRL